jgi:hypothetical protein
LREKPKHRAHIFFGDGKSARAAGFTGSYAASATGGRST